MLKTKKTEKIDVAIIGVTGYTGGELLRILANHSKVNVKYMIAGKSAGKNLEDVYQAYASRFSATKIISYEEANLSEVQCVFCCLPHGQSMQIIHSIHSRHKHLKIIDLSADFRLKSPALYKQFYGQSHFSGSTDIAPESIAYGLPELNTQQIKSAQIIACPGCYPTSAIIPIAPLCRLGLVEEGTPSNPQSGSAMPIIIDSKSGLTGTGRAANMANLFTERNEDAAAYAIFSHRHLSEMLQEIQTTCDIIFTPHTIPISRGIISTIYLKTSHTHNIEEALRSFYQGMQFIKIVPAPPRVKNVAGTNECHIYVQQQGEITVIVSVIDNLCKGSSGQAVQCMNIAFNIEEGCALSNLTPMVP